MTNATKTHTLKEISAMSLCTSCAQMGPIVRGHWSAGRLPAEIVARLPRSASELGTHLCRGCCARLATILSGPNALALRAKLAAYA